MTSSVVIAATTSSALSRPCRNRCVRPRHDATVRLHSQGRRNGSGESRALSPPSRRGNTRGTVPAPLAHGLDRPPSRRERSRGTPSGTHGAGLGVTRTIQRAPVRIHTPLRQPRIDRGSLAGRSHCELLRAHGRDTRPSPPMRYRRVGTPPCAPRIERGQIRPLAANSGSNPLVAFTHEKSLQNRHIGCRRQWTHFVTSSSSSTCPRSTSIAPLTTALCASGCRPSSHSRSVGSLTSLSPSRPEPRGRA